MRSGVIVAMLAAVGCAASGSAGTTPAPESQSISVVGSTGKTGLSMTGADASSTHTVPFSVDQVWRALPAAFDTIGIPVQTLDQSKHTIGNAGYAVRHRLKIGPLSRFIDCGSSQLGPSADDYEVRLMVLTEVRPADGGASSITTTVEASARPANYAQDYGRCNTRGALEARIIDFVKARVAK